MLNEYEFCYANPFRRVYHQYNDPIGIYKTSNPYSTDILIYPIKITYLQRLKNIFLWWVCLV